MERAPGGTISSTEVGRFIRELRRLTVPDIRGAAARLRSSSDDLCWWRTAIAVERRLHARGLGRLASGAAAAARTAVRDAGHDLALDGDNDVAVVAAAAADAARAMVAGSTRAATGLLARARATSRVERQTSVVAATPAGQW